MPRIIPPTAEQKARFVDEALVRGQYSPEQKEYERIKYAPDTEAFTRAGIRGERALEEFNQGNYGQAALSAGASALGYGFGAASKLADFGTYSEPARQGGAWLGKKTGVQDYLNEKLVGLIGKEKEAELTKKTKGVIDKTTSKVMSSIAPSATKYDEALRKYQYAGDVLTAGESLPYLGPIAKDLGVVSKTAGKISNIASKASKTAKPLTEFGQKAYNVTKQTKSFSEAASKVGEFAQKPSVAKTIDLTKKAGGAAIDFAKENPWNTALGLTYGGGTLAMGGTPGDALLNTAYPLGLEKIKQTKLLKTPMTGFGEKVRDATQGALTTMKTVPLTTTLENPELAGYAGFAGATLGLGKGTKFAQDKSKDIIGGSIGENIVTGKNIQEFTDVFVGEKNFKSNPILREMQKDGIITRPIQRGGEGDAAQKIQRYLFDRGVITGDATKDAESMFAGIKAKEQQKMSTLERYADNYGKIPNTESNNAMLNEAADLVKDSIEQTRMGKTAVGKTVGLDPNAEADLAQMMDVFTRLKAGAKDGVFSVGELEKLLVLLRKKGGDIPLDNRELRSKWNRVYEGVREMQINLGNDISPGLGDNLKEINDGIKSDIILASSMSKEARDRLFSEGNLPMLAGGIFMDSSYVLPANTLKNLLLNNSLTRFAAKQVVKKEKVRPMDKITEFNQKQNPYQKGANKKELNRQRASGKQYEEQQVIKQKLTEEERKARLREIREQSLAKARIEGAKTGAKTVDRITRLGEKNVQEFMKTGQKIVQESSKKANKIEKESFDVMKGRVQTNIRLSKLGEKNIQDSMKTGNKIINESLKKANKTEKENYTAAKKRLNIVDKKLRQPRKQISELGKKKTNTNVVKKAKPKDTVKDANLGKTPVVADTENKKQLKLFGEK